MGEIANSGVGEFLYSLYRNQQFTDVTFHPKTGNGSKSAHRVVLAAKCPYFQELLFGKKRKEVFGMEMKVIINNMDFDVFCKILEYFYTDEIDFVNDSTVLNIYVGAKEFHIEALVERCESYIDKMELTELNVCSVFQMSDSENIECLKDRCIEYIQENTGEVLSSPDFKKYPYFTIHMICNLQSLNLSSEAELIDAVSLWTNNQPEHTKSQLKEPLLSCIRFLTFTAKEFGDSVRKHPHLMTPEDALKLMMYLNGAAEYENLPLWCSKITYPRCLGQINRIKYGCRLKNQDKRIKSINVSLKPAAHVQEINELKSTLTMKCSQGSHQIKAFTFSFQRTPLNETVLTIALYIILFPRRYFYNKRVSIYAKDTKFELPKEMRVWQGDIIHVNMQINNIQNCKLLQLSNHDFDQNNDLLFSVKTQNDLFCISEVQYSSRMIPENFPRERKRKKKAAHHSSTKSLSIMISKEELNNA